MGAKGTLLESAVRPAVHLEKQHITLQNLTQGISIKWDNDACFLGPQ